MLSPLGKLWMSVCGSSSEGNNMTDFARRAVAVVQLRPTMSKKARPERLCRAFGRSYSILVMISGSVFQAADTQPGALQAVQDLMEHTLSACVNPNKIAR